ncbi:MAG: hypothetical protein C0498_01415 [Anaerolinea sp.]|nr:hypothetical protein [Anaerolinea sp.]
MNDMSLLGRLVRDRRSGLVGRVVGIVTWVTDSPSVIVQPPVRDDRTVPPTVYVSQGSAEIIPEPAEPPRHLS